MTPGRVGTWTRPDGTLWMIANTADRAIDILGSEGRRCGPKLVAGEHGVETKMVT